MMIAGAVGAPPAAQLGFAVGDGDDLDALAAGVGQPGRDRDGADLGDLVQGHQQRRVEPAAGQPAAGQRGGVVDLAGQAGEQRRDRGVLAAGLGDQVQGPGLAQERGDVQGLARARAGRTRRGRGRRGTPGCGSWSSGRWRWSCSLRRASRRAGRPGAAPRRPLSTGCPRLLRGARAGDPAGDVAQVQAGQGGGVEVAAQVVARPWRPRSVASSTPFWLTELANASARRIATAGSWQPSRGFHRNVDGTAPTPCGLNTCTGPRRARMPEVSSNTSCLVVVDSTGPG